MEQGRIIIAIVLSLLVFLAWDFFFSGKKGIENKEKNNLEEYRYFENEYNY